MKITEQKEVQKSDAFIKQEEKGDIAVDYIKIIDSDKGEVGQSPVKPNLTPNAVKVLERRYLKKDAEGNVIETPEELFRRVANNIALADGKFGSKVDIIDTEKKFYNMIANLEFLPNSPTLMNAGRELQQLSACFVLPIEDSMEDIFTTIKNTALIHKSGGGTGFSFSRLRPANSRVASTSGVSSGPISFMRVFDSATEAIKQGGTRRGANMGILRVDHPDIQSFISCKNEEAHFNNFNISVALTEDFMDRVVRDEEYELYDPNTRTVAKKLKAKQVFDKIVGSAWQNGEPGIIFIDRINRDNPTPHLGEIESTNPCGEQPLLPYESCNLGSINLSRMLKPIQHNGKAGYEIDWNKLSTTIHNAVHFLDNVIEMNKFPLEQIAEMTKGNRKIGLGVMGFADLLIQLRIPYNSSEAIRVAEEVMSFIDSESKKGSARLAETRGVFPNYSGSIYDEKNDRSRSPYKGWRLRNATTTTIAPTGTISIIGNTSSGVEPIFAVSYIRTVMDKDELVEVHPKFEKVAREEGFYSETLMKEIARKGHLKDIEAIPESVRDIFITSHNVSPECHIRMQAIFQKFTDNAVSKTINFNHDATEEDVKKAYILAAQLGCKGLTIYRDGSRESQVLSTGSTYSADNAASKSQPHIVPRPRPQVTRGTSQRIATGCGNLYVTINECDEGRPFEIFTHMGKAGGCAASQSEAIGRLVSLALRSGIDPAEVVDQMVGISCHMQTWDNGTRILSCSDAITKAISFYLKTHKTRVLNPGAAKEEIGLTATSIDSEQTESGKVSTGNGTAKAIFFTGMANICPDCGNQTEHADGCLICRACGYSKCY